MLPWMFSGSAGGLEAGLLFTFTLTFTWHVLVNTSQVYHSNVFVLLEKDIFLLFSGKLDFSPPGFNHCVG